MHTFILFSHSFNASFYLLLLLIYECFFFKKHIKPNISAKNKRGQVVDFKYILVSALRLSDPMHRYLHLKMGLPPELKAGSSGINKDSSIFFKFKFFLKNF
jgi:hypothetical protein